MFARRKRPLEKSIFYLDFRHFSGLLTLEILDFASFNFSYLIDLRGKQKSKNVLKFFSLELIESGSSLINRL